jgi:hypothetical protein
MQQPMPQDPIPNLLYRLDQAEKDIVQVKAQLSLYVPARENELRLQAIQEAVRRIEMDVGESKKQLTDMTGKLAQQRESQDKLQIRVLWGTVAFILSTASLVVAGYITHFFH